MNSHVCPICGESTDFIYQSPVGGVVGCHSCVEKRALKDFFGIVDLKSRCPVCNGFQPFRIFVRRADGKAVACTNCVVIKEA